MIDSAERNSSTQVLDGHSSSSWILGVRCAVFLVSSPFPDGLVRDGRGVALGRPSRPLCWKYGTLRTALFSHHWHLGPSVRFVQVVLDDLVADQAHQAQQRDDRRFGELDRNIPSDRNIFGLKIIPV